MTSEGLGVMFEGDFADMCAGKFPLVSMGGRAEGLACTDPGARTPIGASGINLSFFFLSFFMPYLFSQKGLSWGSKTLHGLLTHKNIRIPIKKNNSGTPPTPLTMLYLGGLRGVFSKVVLSLIPYPSYLIPHTL
jgi:hypothetical protein